MFIAHVSSSTPIPAVDKLSAFIARSCEGQTCPEDQVHAVSLARQATIMTFNFGPSPMRPDTDQLPFAHRLPAISSRIIHHRRPSELCEQ